MDCERWQTFGERALKAIGKEADATVAFVSDRKIKELNKQFRGKDKATDVLSFPAEPDHFAENESNLGDIAISVERAEVQAKENGLSYDQEIAQLILHGLLHLCGFDHETDDGKMNRLEVRLRRKLRI
ncbi:MAG TPA: rRNA maturation RNase YbeY [Pyrinomonadaceae bacterium]|nr:rRNA maturation RNase YbeY [Pyrinomonadaceae bacterium]